MKLCGNNESCIFTVRGSKGRAFFAAAVAVTCYIAFFQKIHFFCNHSAKKSTNHQKDQTFGKAKGKQMDQGASRYYCFLNGNNDALVEIIRDYKDGLMYFLTGFVGDLSLAEELMEDTFVRLYVKKPRFSGNSSFKTWLYAIGRNVAREHIRKEAKRKAVPLEDHPGLTDQTFDPEQSYFQNEENVQLYAAMRRLKPEYCQVLWLQYFEELRDKEIARIMKKTPNNVSVLLHRAKKALKDELEKEGVLE